ncbi:hypothetical protein PG993_011232 [Apiospora rasikravindrae]|uniref:Uncharacterized protein n=1 Tax=Apiospora rasikravindrae TaxID=990691 RepID=A0ABR1SDY8_9PEZI
MYQTKARSSRRRKENLSVSEIFLGRRKWDVPEHGTYDHRPPTDYLLPLHLSVQYAIEWSNIGNTRASSVS